MDHKRKSQATRASADDEERAAKRRRLPQDVDLAKGETPETTTALGLTFLEQIRRTADKSGRLVAGQFEKLPPREDDPEYYEHTRLPISLEIIEDKLTAGEFTTLTELESYFKRMVINVKEYFARNSQMYEDAERVRKALSNYMVKTNPAYQTKGYTAVPTPLPPDDTEKTNGKDDAEGEEDERGEGAEEEEVGELSDVNDDDDEVDGEGYPGDEDEEEDEEDEDEEEDEDSSQVLAIPKRRGPGRPPKNPALHAKKMAAKAARQEKADSQYENVPYKGLTFQQAQEKLAEELIRRREEEYHYFEPFINLPPRSIKDYYRVIAEPISLRKFQKMVNGVQSKNGTGVTEFKSWAAVEEKASLLWRNACYYNEEGSDIYELAKELEEYFNEQFEEAKAAVPEPPQSKIKLKVPTAESTPAGQSKKITIHVGGRGGSTGSQTPLTSAGSRRSESIAPSAVGPTGLRNAVSQQSPAASALSPSPSVKGKIGEDANQVPLTPAAGAPGTPMAQTPAQVQPMVQTPNGAGLMTQQAFAPVPALPPPPPRNPIWEYPWRPEGKGLADAGLSSFNIIPHPNAKRPSQDFGYSVKATPDSCHQSVAHHLWLSPPASAAVYVYAQLTDALEASRRHYQLWVLRNGQVLSPRQYAPKPGGGPSRIPVYETYLGVGTNVFEAHLVSEIPAEEKVPGGHEAVLEKFTIHVNVPGNE